MFSYRVVEKEITGQRPCKRAFVAVGRSTAWPPAVDAVVAVAHHGVIDRKLMEDSSCVKVPYAPKAASFLAGRREEVGTGEV